MSFLSTSRKHRHDQALLGVHRQADVKVFLIDDFAGGLVQAGVENGMGAQGGGDDVQGEGGERQTDALLSKAGGVFFAQLLQGRDVGLVKLRDARRGAASFRSGAVAMALRTEVMGRLATGPHLEINVRQRLGGTGAGAGLRGQTLQALDVGAHVVHDDAAALSLP